MTLPWILALAAVTYGSRAAALVFMRDPSPRVRAVLERMPAPLFAGLAALSLVEPGGGRLAAVPVLGAMAGALVTTPFRSLLVTLAGGLIGFGVAVWLG